LAMADFYAESGAMRLKTQAQRKRTVICLSIFLLAAALLSASGFLLLPKKDGAPAPSNMRMPLSKDEALSGIEIESIIQNGESSIAVHYPKTKNPRVNQAIADMIDAQVNAFKAGATPAIDGHKDELYIHFEVYRYDQHTASFVFDTHIARHAADGERRIDTVTYNLASGRLYTLKDILASDDYLKVLSGMVYDGLIRTPPYQRSGEAAFLVEGLKPTAENFSRFALEPDKLILFFDPHQIGSLLNSTDRYAIDLRDLKGMLRPEFEDKEDIVPETRPLAGAPLPTPAFNLQEDVVLENKKLVALTFDDGPHAVRTSQLLDILRDTGAKATFFVLGSRAEFYPELLHRIVLEGHQLGSHTQNHKELTKLGDLERKREIEDTAAIIMAATGQRPTAMRPPYGSYDQRIIRDTDANIVLWSVDPQDWKEKDPKKIARSVVEHTKDGDIILMHDIHPQSVEAARLIIRKLSDDGYAFITVDHLIRLRGQDITTGVFSALPKKD
jgi:peptidoglycan/xylan/chitin deacetylase (PgdA/CDA1 family)